MNSQDSRIGYLGSTTGENHIMFVPVPAATLILVS